jgi:hypothetical protein
MHATHLEIHQLRLQRHMQQHLLQMGMYSIEDQSYHVDMMHPDEKLMRMKKMRMISKT